MTGQYSPTTNPEGSKIMVVDDDKDIANILGAVLEDNGYRPYLVTDPRKAVEIFNEFQPDLITLDVMMPSVDGVSLCLKIREKSNVPVLFLSAKQDAPDRVVGLRIGADDYMGKPFNNDELVARVEALLRRSRRIAPAEDATPIKICFGDLCIDTASVQMTKNGETIALTPTEFKLIKTLASKPNEVFTREQLLPTVWGYDPSTTSRLIDVHVGRLRKRLIEAGINEFEIETSRGFGYRLVPRA